MDIQTRISEFGRIGTYLFGLINGTDFMDQINSHGTYVAKLIALRNSMSSLRERHALLPAAASLLLLPFPLQVELSIGDVLLLLRSAFNLSYGTTIQAAISSNAIPEILSDNLAGRARRIVTLVTQRPDFREKYFPVKKHPGAQTKANVHLAGLVRSAVVLHGRGIIGRVLLATAGRLTDDQASSLLIYGSGLLPTFGALGWAIATHMVLYPDDAKALNGALKALGTNSTPYGCLLVEANTLQGRGVGAIDMREKARERCDPDFIQKSVVSANFDELREHVRAVITTELSGRDVKMPTLSDFWTSRWAWCVNGSETAKSDEVLGLDPKAYKRTHTRSYRRMAAESVRDEPISTWDGTTYASASPKLEAGKTRAIFACDTRSYFAFSWCLNAVQKAWRNSRVLLDPGIGGHLGMVNRIRHAQRGGGVNLMLDFDDFNSQHHTVAMQIVFDELCKYIGAPDWYRHVLVNSFTRTHVSIDGRWELVQGTLMSGHRGTTFINSVLNAAYIRMAVGGPYFDSLLSLHTGDDVYIRANTLGDCDYILNRCRDYGCRLNPAKQSVGYYGAEFLRVAIRGERAYGYFARGVSGFVNGNWTSSDPLSLTEGLSSAIASCRTLINRSGDASLADLLGPAIRYRRGLTTRQTIQLLRGTLSLEGSPVFNTNYIIRNLRVEGVDKETVPIDNRWKRYATTDYLTDHLSPVEVEAIHLAKTDPGPLMIASGYRKGLNLDDKGTPSQVRFRPLPPRLATGFASASQLTARRAEPGCLAKYPVLSLIAGRLTDDELRHLVAMEGGNNTTSDIRKEAFGESPTSKNIIGFLSYADAAALSKVTSSGNIFTSISVRV
ncbi:RNA dependent RNA polymerase [Aspergillus foetidus slow virus 1]|uniref:RNA-directed RNA polymerase n=1 Tax=Aspergillus foetidus slow virus 1 TaxID=1087070 RepID=I7HZB6_9VIRU|nr:RNA dependent RNA polymerase [Aspergillus foetidus slow virus 1]CCD33024.1 RNA dependent RNA polymerase [Aspergillus foetidus slow virus 1]